MASGTNSSEELGVNMAGSEVDNNHLIEPHSYDDAIVKQFAAATLLWALFATLAGLAIAHLLVIPKMFGGVETLSFGRLRPLHSSVAIYAFLANGIFAAIYYSTQRLCGVKNWSWLLSRLHFWLWQFIIIAAIFNFPEGLTQARSQADLLQPIYFAILFVWTSCFAVNFFMTLRTRKVKKLYVSLWFYAATIVTFPLLLAANSIALPISWVKSYPFLAGAQDMIVQWCYGRSAIYYLLLMPFLGMMYYFVPLVSGKRLSSYRLATIHFWALVALLLWSGTASLHYTAIPEWISSVGMLAGLLLWMPLWGGLLNGWRTLRGGAVNFGSSIAYRFFMVALLFYGISTLEASVLSIKSVSAMTQYTDWMIAHLHSGMMGWNGMLAFGILYWLMPRLFKVEIWSERGASLHFWISLMGVLLSVVPLYISGIIQSTMWGSMDELGNLIYPDFFEAISASRIMWWIRIMGGMLYVIGLVLMVANFAMTWVNRSSACEVGSEVPVNPSEAESEIESPGTLDHAPVLDAARALERWSKLHWHQRWESTITPFFVIPILLVLVVSLVLVLPNIIFKSAVPQIASVKPYSPLELLGRDIYRTEGCFNCHSQMVRPMVAETKRYGDFSRAGEFVFDFPAFWGKRRIGPDLAREGGNKQTSIWHWRHFEDPTAFVDGSVMPSYSHLLDAKIDFDEVAQQVKTARLLGVAYEEEMDVYLQSARDHAERVAADIVSSGGTIRRGEVMTLESKAVALIAYLQRLGTDISAPVTADSKDDSAETAMKDDTVTLTEYAATSLSK